MKKKLIVGVSALALTMGITGCGSNSGNSFKCTASEDSIQSEMIVYYDGDTVTKMTQKYIYSSADEASGMYAMYQAFASMGDDSTSGMPTDVKLDGKTISMSLSGDGLKAEYDSLNKDDIKKELQDGGYTCK